MWLLLAAPVGRSPEPATAAVTGLSAGEEELPRRGPGRAGLTEPPPRRLKQPALGARVSPP